MPLPARSSPVPRTCSTTGTPADGDDALASALQAAVGSTYVVTSELGAGGMARVFLATEPAAARRVAIKVLSPSVASCCDAERFRQEMAVAGALAHPNIVPLLRECEVCGGERLFYFVMPYVEGESLRERLDRDGPLPAPDVVRVLRDVASALAHAHRAGVVHRDIKPGNVLLSQGRALVTDFGVAKALSAAARPDATATGRGAANAHDVGQPADGAAGLTVAGYMVGTPAYAAPEQALGDPAADHRADLYALGVLAYELLAGAPPFVHRSPRALIAAHLTETPAALPARPDLPPALATLVMWLLAKAPEDRPGSADAVLEALARIHP